jgi:hypothetical protein
MSDGFVTALGVWQRPANWPQDVPWRVPREEVDGTVDQVFADYRPIAFFADPGAGHDDADGERYWDGYIDAWAQRYGKKLKLKAVTGGANRHAVLWDMRDRRRQQAFTEAVDRFYRDVLERQLTHDGHRVLRQHVANARRRTNQWGYTIGKEHRESARKIDLAVCAIGARMLRRMMLNSTAWAKRGRPGKGRVVVLR